LKKKYLFLYINIVHENYFFNLIKVKINVIDRAIDIWGNNILVFEDIPIWSGSKANYFWSFGRGSVEVEGV
jgi:hypothetical protein